MRYLGKLIGFLIGSAILGPLGAVVGLLLGHVVDLGRRQDAFKQQESQRIQARKTFFQTTFLVMGYLAKVDGRVSEKEIQTAREIMVYLGLDQAQKLRAIRFFSYGKTSEFNFNEQLDIFAFNCGNHPNLVELFVEIQLKSIMADNSDNQYKQYALKEICRRLDFSNEAIESLLYQYQSEKTYRQQAQTRNPVDQLQRAYIQLGISKDVDNSTVKKTYKKLVSQNHPDKLVAKGLPEEMVKLATEKMQRIQEAYELICRSRNIK